ncbi:MAG: HEAT repeat domain-containing protein [Spirochaetales bacterium]|nr:MAG: HEAT repeat domain-containing protein [Spirochaetales bacterium]
MRVCKYVLCAIVSVPFLAIPVRSAASENQYIETLRSGSYERRIDAMLHLGFAGNKAAFFYLVENLNSGHDREPAAPRHIRTRSVAAEALGRLRDDRAIPHLVARYGDEESPEVKRSILFALSFFKSAAAEGIVNDGLSSGDEGVLFEAIRTAALSGNASTAPRLREIAAKSPVERVRLAGAYALVALGDTVEKNMTLLEEGLKSRDAESRFWAAVYLGEVGRAVSLESLAKAREIENMEWVKREIDISAARLATMRKRQREREEDERLDRILADRQKDESGADLPDRGETR